MRGLHFLDGTSVERVGRVTTYHPALEKIDMMNQTTRSIVSFADGKETFHVYLPYEADHITVAKLIEQIYTGIYTAGEFAAEFIKLYRTKHNSGSLISHTVPYYKHISYLYRLCVGPNKSITVLALKGSAVVLPELFNGSLSDFCQWADSSRLLKSAVDKVVKFVYKGGSGTHERLVKLTSVLGSGNAILLKGWDVNKSTAEKPAYRTYRVGNIVGKVEVIG